VPSIHQEGLIMRDPTRDAPKLTDVAERVARAWSIGEHTAEISTARHHLDKPHHRLGEYITMSREAGACGAQVAELLGAELGWRVIDRQFIEQIAQRYRLSPSMLELVDETVSDWAHDILGPYLDHRVVPHEKYAVYLDRVAYALARRGNVILVGRGAHCVLPRDQGMAVRLVASEKFRIRHIMEKMGVNETIARRRMIEVDRGRLDFVMRFFHRDAADPHLYDLVVHVDRFGAEGAAKLIADAYRHTFAPAHA
jgi:cytidylate kinase